MYVFGDLGKVRPARDGDAHRVGHGVPDGRGVVRRQRCGRRGDWRVGGCEGVGGCRGTVCVRRGEGAFESLSLLRGAAHFHCTIVVGYEIVHIILW